MTWLAIPLAVATAGATVGGGLLALRFSRALPTLLALTGGIVVAVALFDVLPEAIRAVGDEERLTTLIGAGFVAFFVIERFLVLHHRDSPEEARGHAQVGALGAFGLSVHSFLDGLGIGFAFGVDTTTGMLVFLAVVGHDFADGMNTVSFVLSQSGDRRKARRWLAVDAVAPILGAIVGTSVAISKESLGTILALYVGFFLYIGATDLLPHAHEHASWRRVGLTAGGFAFIYLIKVLAPG